MRQIKNTKNMTFGELKEYYKNNKTIMARLEKSESYMKKRGMSDKEIEDSRHI